MNKIINKLVIPLSLFIMYGNCNAQGETPTLNIHIENETGYIFEKKESVNQNSITANSFPPTLSAGETNIPTLTIPADNNIPGSTEDTIYYNYNPKNITIPITIYYDKNGFGVPMCGYENQHDVRCKTKQMDDNTYEMIIQR